MNKNLLFSLVLFLLIMAVVLSGFNSVMKVSSDSDLNRVRENIKDGIVECYAIEGRYPESIEYLINNYGLYLNDEYYQVHYRFLADNIMPEYMVFVKGDRQ